MKNGNGQNGSSLKAAIDAVCDILRSNGCAGAMQYAPELTWMLFLRFLDWREKADELSAKDRDEDFSPLVAAPYRWRDWAAKDGKQRALLWNKGGGAILSFVRERLFPRLRDLQNADNLRQKVIGKIFADVGNTRINDETGLLDALGRLDAIDLDGIDSDNAFPISQAYENLLLDMGAHNSDSGQFFTPRVVVRAMVRAIDPKIGETVLDPCCGTGGFLAEAHEYMRPKASPLQLENLAAETFYGREKERMVFPIALANLILHGIETPNIWHGDTLMKRVEYGDLFENAPNRFHIALTNPPFGGKVNREVRAEYRCNTTSTQALFVLEILDALQEGGRCGIVLDEGFLFGLGALVQIKRRLLSEFDLRAIVSLPPGVFAQAGTGVKTNLLFFTKGKPTEKIWYYELKPPPWKDRRTGKMRPGTRFTVGYPLTIDHFAEFFRLLPKRDDSARRGDSARSWTIDFSARQQQAEIEARPHRREADKIAAQIDSDKRKIAKLRKKKPRPADAIAALESEIKSARKAEKDARKKAETIENDVYDLKAVNPNAQDEQDNRTPEQLTAEIARDNREIAAVLKRMQARR